MLFSRDLLNTCLQECLEGGSFLQDKMRQCFKDNTHCLTLTMSPDVSEQRRLYDFLKGEGFIITVKGLNPGESMLGFE